MTTAEWIAKWRAHDQGYYTDNPGASEAEIERLREFCRQEYGYELSKDYEEYLRLQNGGQFNFVYIHSVSNAIDKAIDYRNHEVIARLEIGEEAPGWIYLMEDGTVKDWSMGDGIEDKPFREWPNFKDFFADTVAKAIEG